MSTRQRQRALKHRALNEAANPQASLMFLRSSARKVRLVLELIEGRRVEDAMNVLQFSSKRVAAPLLKLLSSAVANADEKGRFDVDRLYVKAAKADEGPILRRWMPRAMGRATRIRKRTAHVHIELAQVGSAAAAAVSTTAE